MHLQNKIRTPSQYIISIISWYRSCFKNSITQYTYTLLIKIKKKYPLSLLYFLLWQWYVLRIIKVPKFAIICSQKSWYKSGQAISKSCNKNYLLYANTSWKMLQRRTPISHNISSLSFSFSIIMCVLNKYFCIPSYNCIAKWQHNSNREKSYGNLDYRYCCSTASREK